MCAPPKISRPVRLCLKLGDNGRFAKTIFYYMRADTRNSCSVVVKGKAVNLGDGDGMQVHVHYLL